jgi:hypothetical protein
MRDVPWPDLVAGFPEVMRDGLWSKRCMLTRSPVRDAEGWEPAVRQQHAAVDAARRR